MKITWFGKSVFRIYLGGRILVADAAHAPNGISTHELVAAADRQIDLSGGTHEHPQIDENWRSARPKRLIDQPEEVIEELYTLSGEGVFIDEPEEGPLVLAPVTETAWGPFADNAVVVFFGQADGLEQEVRDLFASARPRLIALAVSDLADGQFEAIGALCRNCALQVLETELALEA